MSPRILFIFVLAIVAALALRHHREQVALARNDAAQIDDVDTPDPAVLLRSLSPATTQPALTSKPWLDDFAKFVSDHPGRWIVGHSAEPCLSEADAARAARDDAATQICSLLLQNPALRGVDARAVQRHLVADLQSEQLQTDRLAEQFQRPYGVVWTESILLDASQPRIDALAGKYAAEQVVQQARSGKTRLIAIGIVAVAWCFCLFFNSITKGYFATRLSVVAAAIMVCAIVLVA